MRWWIGCNLWHFVISLRWGIYYHHCPVSEAIQQTCEMVLAPSLSTTSCGKLTFNSSSIHFFHTIANVTDWILLWMHDLIITTLLVFLTVNIQRHCLILLNFICSLLVFLTVSMQTLLNSPEHQQQPLSFSYSEHTKTLLNSPELHQHSLRMNMLRPCSLSMNMHKVHA